MASWSSAPALAQEPAAGSTATFPLTHGAFWVYRETYTEHLGELDSSQEARTRFEVRGSPARPFILQTGGFDPASGPVERGDGWLRLAPWTGEEALPWPPEVGREAPGPDGAPGWRVEAEEQVSVPAGTFTARRCALRTRRSESVLWVVPGVGVVRETQGQPRQRPEIERVLLEWAVPGAAGGASGPGGNRPRRSASPRLTGQLARQRRSVTGCGSQVGGVA